MTEDMAMILGLLAAAVILYFSIGKIYRIMNPNRHGWGRKTPVRYVEENKAIRYFKGSL